MVELVVGTAQRGRPGVGEIPERFSNQLAPGSAKADRGLQSAIGDLVAVRGGDALDQPVESKPAKVVGHLPAGQCAGIKPEQGCQELAQVVVGEPAWQQAEHDQCRQQHLRPERIQAQPGDPLVADGLGRQA